jgi:hypothetical protein
MCRNNIFDGGLCMAESSLEQLWLASPADVVSNSKALLHTT